MAWVGVPAQAAMPNIGYSMPVRRIFRCTSSLTRCLGASSKTYDGGIQPNRRTPYDLQLSGCLPDKLPHMVN
eukprot:CAMPEP_0172622040 /NCGR_PEP_ID=MMETSP1068-20121228/117376_1 /TAXON_ID=35684 /ORGANISM="Pseudopedinella elastica, Strain CCMP716" /LENGTH=71 /DNA_ID=CAMNT_0013430065 /DNA_START=72 /DNA_END=290 /DNA_ORIENTATION=-